jgi:hypothetical protein
MADVSQQQHEMLLDKVHSSGAEEWYCPECGRRILRRVPPTQTMIILEPGDLSAIHSGSRGGLRIGTVQIAQQDAEPGEVADENLHFWIKALEDLDLGE